MNGALNVQDTIIAGVTSDTAAIGNNFSIGADFLAGGPAAVDIAAVVVGSGTALGADIERLEGWAAHRYGLSASLPAGHPYKTLPPKGGVNDGNVYTSVTGAPPSAGQITHPSLSRRWSVEHGGNGRIYGNTVEYIAPEVDLSYPCRVRLVRDFDGVQIAEQWSAADGSFDFTWINPRWKYTVLAYDPVRNYRAVVADGVTPEAMPWQ